MAHTVDGDQAGHSREILTRKVQARKILASGLQLAGVRTVFGIDLRTLALFRLLLGVYIFTDVCLRARDLAAHYTDFGVMPRYVQLAFLADGSWSLHLFNGSFVAQAVLFVLAALAALALAVGWRTRLMTVVSWVLLISVQNRNTFILSGEDNLVLLMTFWAMFLPIGARFSVDAALARPEQKSVSTNAYFSVATMALLIQGMSMYLFSALLKSDPMWMPDGLAVYYALNLDYMVTPFAVWFREFESVMRGLTFYVWTLELAGPILIFSPILHRPLRALLMAMFISMHLGFLLFLEIGLFPIISIIMNLTFMPGWMWNEIGKWLSKGRGEPPTIWYDQGCDFCLKTSLFIRTFLFLSDAPVRPAQSDKRIGEIFERESSWIVESGSVRKTKFDGLQLLVAASPIFRPLAAPLQWSPIIRLGNVGYNWVTRNRTTLSCATARLFPWNSQHERTSKTRGAFCAAALVFITIQNLSTIPSLHLHLPNAFIQVRQAFGLYQNWTMFAPYPELTSPWPVIEGELKDGAVVDVYNGRMGPADRDRPKFVSAQYENYRWRKFLSNLEDQSYLEVDQILALNYARYLCRNWNVGKDEAERLSTFVLSFMVERTPPPGEKRHIKQRDVWFHDCFG